MGVLGTGRGFGRLNVAKMALMGTLSLPEHILRHCADYCGVSTTLTLDAHTPHAQSDRVTLTLVRAGEQVE